MATPSPSLTVIGVVRSARTERIDTPVQAALNPDETAAVQVHEAFLDGLDGLQDFDYVWLLTWLAEQDAARGEEVALRQVPFLLAGRERRELGIFATR